MKRALCFVLAFIFLVSFISSQECTINAKNTDDFLKEIPDLNSKLPNCNTEVPSPMNRLFGNDMVNVQIVRNNGSKSNVKIKIENRIVKSIELGYFDKPTYVATLAECALDNVLKSDNKAGALAYLYSNKHLTIGSHGVWRSIKFKVIMFFAKGAIRSNSQQIETTCPKKAVGEVCNHGGECETGNCVGVGQGPPWTYECSCDPYRYVAADTDGNCPA